MLINWSQSNLYHMFVVTVLFFLCQAKHTFSKYGPGARFIQFKHFGIDTQFWKGWYGAKMTLSSVVIKISPALAGSASGYSKSDEFDLNI